MNLRRLQCGTRAAQRKGADEIFFFFFKNLVAIKAAAKLELISVIRIKETLLQNQAF
jgi:hypothetical protein